MGLDMVLNEVSLENAANDIPTARQLMSGLFGTVSAFAVVVGRGNLKLEICTPKGLLALPLAPEYPVIRWIKDSSVEKEHIQLLLAIVANKPFIDDVDDTYEEEFLYQGKSVKSLGYAYSKEALSVSLKSEECWNYSHLEVQYRHLDSIGEIVEESVDVIHASDKMHIQEHTFWIQSSSQAAAYRLILDGSHLWDHREELFPHLQFCRGVEGQLRAILPGDIMLNPIHRKLYLLEQFCVNWPVGHPFEPRNMHLGRSVSPESEATLKKYGQKRVFICPDGVSRRFSWHVKFNPDAWRIYFHPFEEKKLLIGYIGRHLPIATS